MGEREKGEREAGYDGQQDVDGKPRAPRLQPDTGTCVRACVSVLVSHANPSVIDYQAHMIWRQTCKNFSK